MAIACDVPNYQVGYTWRYNTMCSTTMYVPVFSVCLRILFCNRCSYITINCKLSGPRCSSKMVYWLSASISVPYFTSWEDWQWWWFFSSVYIHLCVCLCPAGGERAHQGGEGGGQVPTIQLPHQVHEHDGPPSRLLYWLVLNCGMWGNRQNTTPRQRVE